MGPLRIVLIRVETKLSQLRSVAESIASMSDFKSVTMTAGTYGILAMFLVEDLSTGVERLNAEIVAYPAWKVF